MRQVKDTLSIGEENYEAKKDVKIALDLDGVLRDLNTYLHNKYNVPFPQSWLWTHEDKDIYSWVAHSGLQALIDAPETKYSPIVRMYVDKIDIWTCQPMDWRENTLKWVKHHFGCPKVRFLSTKEKEERLEFLTDTILVEDSPQFTNYNKIVLVNTPYNKHIKAPHRISTPGELRDVIMLKGSEQNLK